jgi:hypothetical protein
MAIFPFSNAYVINKDAVVGSSFKAGMVLMQDNNGQVKPADSLLFVFKSMSEKQSAIIGIAAGDSNVSGNTIIVPDYIGSNYLDANLNFISISDREYVSVKRQLLDYADETVNEYYNINYSPAPKRRGIGIYPLTGETFATDQFKPVLHGDYGIDSTGIVSFLPGDLLTFGGGINAGKLVKVNSNSLGSDVLVVGIVDRYNLSTGLLYFRQVNYSLSFGNTSSARLSLDAGNINSFSSPSSTTAIDMSRNNNGTLINGVGYDSIGGGSWSFDGTNDYIDVPLTNYILNIASVTVFCWVNLSLPTFGTFFHLGDANNGVTMGVGDVYTQEPPGTKVVVLYPNIRWITNSYNMGTYSNGWNFVAISFDSSKYPTVYLNNNAGIYIAFNDFNSVGAYKVTIGREVGIPSRSLTGKISDLRMYSRALSATEISNYYNATKARYGL